MLHAPSRSGRLGPVQIVLEEAAYGDERTAPLVAEVQQEYVVRYGGPDETPVDPGEFAAPGGVFLVATVDGRVVGCGGLRRHDADVVEIKRMYVRAAHRRQGHARALLRALEQRAADLGYRRVVLETGSAQPEAIALYTGEGYRPTEGFGHYRCSPESRSFAKDLTRPRS